MRNSFNHLRKIMANPLTQRALAVTASMASYKWISDQPYLTTSLTPKHPFIFRSHHTDTDSFLFGGAHEYLELTDAANKEFVSISSSELPSLTSHKEMFNLNREETISFTRRMNSFVTTCSFVGFLASGGQGALRVALPDKVPPIANSTLMPTARLLYDTGSTGRSVLRNATTHPEKRLEEEAKIATERSNDFSKLSIAHGVLTAAAIFLPQRLVDGFSPTSITSVALKYFRGPGFNMTGLLGITAALFYVYGEDIATKGLVSRSSAALRNQHNSWVESKNLDDRLKMSPEEAQKIVKNKIPHQTDDEFYAKMGAFAACAIAACGGLGSVPLLLSARYPAIAAHLGKETLTKLGDIGGRANGMFYATWPIFVALTHEDYNSEQRRLPEHLNDMWKELRQQAILESTGIFTLTMAALITFYRAKDGSHLKRVADIALNKMDVIAGGTVGSWFLGAAFLQDKNPSFHKQTLEILNDKDGILRDSLKVSDSDKMILMEMLEAKDSPHRKALLNMLQDKASPFSQIMEQKSPSFQKTIRDLLSDTESSFQDLLASKRPSLKEKLINLFEDNPLLLSGFFARSVWLGPRMSVFEETCNYLEHTDPAKYSLEERTAYLHMKASALRTQAAIPDYDTIPYDALKQQLENGTFHKEDHNDEMASKGISTKRPICPAAYYAAQMLRESTRRRDDMLEEIKANTKRTAPKVVATSASLQPETSTGFKLPCTQVRDAQPSRPPVQGSFPSAEKIRENAIHALIRKEISKTASEGRSR